MNDVGAGLEKVPVCRREGKDGVSPVEVESEVLLSEIEVQLIHHQQMNKCKSELTNDKLKHPQWLAHWITILPQCSITILCILSSV